MKAMVALCAGLFLHVNVFAQSKILMKFKNYAGDELLQTQHEYSNAAGEKFTVRNLRYYISNIILKNGLQNEMHNEHLLIDESDSTSKNVMMDTKLRHINSIEFLIGVDSMKNVNGVQTGNLDPAKGMFWTWNTGYVMAKLDGNSEVAKTPQHAFSFHVGGYKTGEQTARSVALNLPVALDCSKDDATLIVKADVLKWFNGIHLIKIANSPLCHEPGSLAVMLADNYATMFIVEEEQ